jgi:hypothetical protein
VGSLDDEQDARSFFIIPIFFCWDYITVSVWNETGDEQLGLRL